MFNLIQKNNIMTKLGMVSEETNELIEKIIRENNLDNYINIKAYAVNKGREVIKIKKANPIEGELTKDEQTVFVIVYEEAFERLTDNYQEILMRDVLNNIQYNPENGKITIGAPRITVTTWGLQKYGEDLLNAAESAVLALEQIDEEQKERKRAESENKKTKKN